MRPGSASERRFPAERRLASLVALALVLLFVGQVLRFSDELALAFGGSLLSALQQGKLGVLLVGSRFGALWLLRSTMLAAGVALIALRMTTKGRAIRRWFWVACSVVGVGLIADLAWSGHAAAGSLLAYASLIQVTLGWADWTGLYLSVAAALIGVARALTLIADLLHLAAVSVWVGGVVALATHLGTERGVWASGRPDGHIYVKDTPSRWRADTGSAVAIARFSRVATVAMFVVLATGLYNTWLYLAGPASFLTTGYGQSLLLKHALVLALLVMAALNHFVTVPLLTARKKSTDFPRLVRRLLTTHTLRTVRLEAGLGVVVLLSTGLLTSLAPARTPQQILLDPARELRLASVATTDPRASELLGQSAKAMAGIRSARMVESLGDGAGGLNLTEYSFVGPDREQIVSPNGGAVIQIGTTIYTRQKSSESWRIERGATPYLWPGQDYSYLQQGVGAIVVGDRSILGHDCTVVAFYAPGSAAVYEEWIGKQDHLIHQEIMAAPSHYMVNLYEGFDGMVRINPPDES